jgi:hypothetical protein
MAILKLKNKTDNSIIEIISFNIDNNNDIITIEDNKVVIITLENFRDMTIGTEAKNGNKAADPTHEITD